MVIRLWKKSHLEIYLLNQWMYEANLGNLLVRLNKNTGNSPISAHLGNKTAMIICMFLKLHQNLFSIP